MNFTFSYLYNLILCKTLILALGIPLLCVLLFGMMVHIAVLLFYWGVLFKQMWIDWWRLNHS